MIVIVQHSRTHRILLLLEVGFRALARRQQLVQDLGQDALLHLRFHKVVAVGCLRDGLLAELCAPSPEPVVPAAVYAPMRRASFAVSALCAIAYLYAIVYRCSVGYQVGWLLWNATFTSNLADFFVTLDSDESDRAIAMRFGATMASLTLASSFAGMRARFKLSYLFIEVFGNSLKADIVRYVLVYPASFCVAAYVLGETRSFLRETHKLRLTTSAQRYLASAA